MWNDKRKYIQSNIDDRRALTQIVHGYVGGSVDWLQHYSDNKPAKLKINSNILVFFTTVINIIKITGVICLPLTSSTPPLNNLQYKIPKETEKYQDIDKQLLMWQDEIKDHQSNIDNPDTLTPIIKGYLGGNVYWL